MVNRLVLLFMMLVCASACADEKGVSTERPAEGIFVRVGDKYLVSYLETIPGTDIQFEMVPVPGGKFLMGSPKYEYGRREDEGPQIEVTVEPMWVGRHEVTQLEYHQFELLYQVFVEIESKDRFLDEDPSSGKVVTAPTPLYDPSYTYEKGIDSEYPAVAMTQFAAQQYTKWVGVLTGLQYRLPTEAEWEYACRGGTKTAFHWGKHPNRAAQFAWTNEDSTARYSKVGQKEPNPFGLYDMHGNVAEWTVNAHSSDGYRWIEKKFGKGPVPALDTVMWPKVSTGCVARGGSFEFDLARLRSSARLRSDDELWKFDDPMYPQSLWWFTSEPAKGVGFRVFRSYQPLDDGTIKKFWDHTAPEIHESVAYYLQGARGQIGILDERIVPVIRKYHEKLRESQRKRKEQLERIRKSRPQSE